VPELPEVEVVRRGLAQHVVGRTVTTARLSGVRVARRHDAGPDDLTARLEGSVVEAADRRGKYLWLAVRRRRADAHALVVHLGMSGQLLVQEPAAPKEKHLHATFEFADAGPQLRFVDQRTFGGVYLAALVPDPHAAGTGASEHPHGVPESVRHIAPDPLEAAYDLGAVARRMKARQSAVKRALLDQALVSGIGNIYADEALWRAGVHPERLCSALTKPTLGRALHHAADVMREALDRGGTSFDALYVDVNGASGYFDRSLDAYGQTGRPCGRCGTPIRRAAFMNRSSHYCPRCQPRPRMRGA